MAPRIIDNSICLVGSRSTTHYANSSYLENFNKCIMKPYNNQKISTLLTQITGQLNKNIFKDHETDLNWTYIPQANRNFESELMVDFKNTEFYMTDDFISVGSFKRCVWRLGCLSKSKHIEIIKKENFDDIKYKIIQHLNDMKENQIFLILNSLKQAHGLLKKSNPA